MRVLVDSSAWIDYLNGYPSAERDHLRTLLASEDAELCTCGLIATEVLQGLRRDERYAEVLSLFSQLELLEPEGLGVYVRAADLYRQLRSRGTSIRSTVDCLIAAIAEARGCWVLFRDKDLATIFASGAVRAEAWPPRERTS